MVSLPFGLRGLLSSAVRLGPDRLSVGLALLTAALLILSFPDFNFAFLAWVAFVPLLYAITFRVTSSWGAFVLGWIVGIVYYIGTVYWLTYAMIHFGGFPWPIAYFLLVPPAIGVALIPAGFAWLLRRTVVRWGPVAIWLAPVIWIASELLRYRLFGQLWIALGYSQAFHPSLIQSARWGGVFAVSGLLVLTNATVAFWLGSRSRLAVALTVGTALILLLNVAWGRSAISPATPGPAVADVVFLQPNVPMEPAGSVDEENALLQRHVDLSEAQLAKLSGSGLPRLVVWPESPMTFEYSRDSVLREQLTGFATRNRTSLLINSLEPAPNNGAYNSAMLIDQDGRLLTQYDKIYLLAFGEYMPIPSWVPGVYLIPPVVGNFTRGDHYPLLRVGPAKAGVMICFESAVPDLAGRYSADGADVLIEITNDGYLGPTPVMRQHLGNAIFRAVENQRPVIRSTNTGISAKITATGEVLEPSRGFEVTARTWQIARATSPPTFYARYGDVLAIAWSIVTLALLALVLYRRSNRGPLAE